MPARHLPPSALRRTPRQFMVLGLAILSLTGGMGVAGAPPPKAACNNTGGGEYLLADSAGFVCPRASLNPGTGCCGTGGAATAFSCATCDLESACCTSYEHCVSCCLKPGHPGADPATVSAAFRARGHPETGHWDSAFAFCAGTCRTTRESTAHENAYISPAHFCYSATGVPRYPEPDPEPPALPAGVIVVAAEAGTTCATACEAADGGPLACAHGPAAAAALSDCNALRAAFPCEAGCLAADDGSTPAPAYVLPSASKTLRPAACLTLATEEVDEEEEDGEEGDGGGKPAAAAKGPPPPAGCEASVADVRRLCACEKKKGGAAAAEDG